MDTMNNTSDDQFAAVLNPWINYCIKNKKPLDYIISGIRERHKTAGREFHLDSWTTIVKEDIARSK